MIKVLLTAVGCPGGPSIIQSLREDKDIFLIGTDMRLDVPGKYLVDKFYQIPSGKSPDFISELLKIVEKEKIDILLPLATFELLNLSENIAKFSRLNCEVLVSEYESLLKANDRFLLYNEFKENEFVPKFKVLENGNNIKNEAKELGYPEEKVVIKPFISHGSIGLRIIDDKVDLFENFINKKPNTINIPMNFVEQIFIGQKPNNILLSEYLPGKEYGIDLLIDPKTNKIIHFVTRDNGEVFHSEISNGKIINDERFIIIAEHIVSKLKLAYTINIDFKLDKDGNVKLLEINPRMPATSYLAFSAGFNFALNSIYLALGKSLDIKPLNTDRNIYSYRGFMVRDSSLKIVKRC